MTPPRDPRPRPAEPRGLARAQSLATSCRRGLALVWATSPRLTVALALLTLLAGLLPAAASYVAKLIVDAVVEATRGGSTEPAIRAVLMEAGLLVVLSATQRGLSVCQSLLRALLGQRVNVMILEKALTLHLSQFEDADFYDRLTQARRQASVRPLSMVLQTFDLIQNCVALASYGALLLAFSPVAVVVLVLAGIPAFVAETKFSGEAFRLFRWQSPETRHQAYLEVLVAREDFAKEVKLFGLGPLFLQRYKDIFERLYRQDASLTLRRGLWGYLLSLLSTGAFYGAYVWIVLETAARRISLGDMTMYLLLFKQGQAAVSSVLSTLGRIYEDNLYIANLYEYLGQPALASGGRATSGPEPSDGIRFEHVSFTYPGSSRPALEDVTLHLKPGEKLALVGENGSGKTTLIKLLAHLYSPQEGRILLDGRDLEEWDEEALRRRIGVIFQDFARYQLKVGENIGAGDLEAFEDEERWRDSARRGRAEDFIDRLASGYHTQLGRWFKDGQELSGGQWQKVALSRAFMRSRADLLILDEPTAAMDAQAEAEVFSYFQEQAQGRMVILISHRFSTVRMADHIVVLDGGRVLEEGSHEALVAAGGRYAHLFELQAEGYR